MLRGFVLTVVVVLLTLQFLASLFETALYAGEKIYMDKNDLIYTKGWLYNFKWAIKPISAVVALGLVLPAMCSCCCGGPDRRFGTGGRVFPSVLAFFSVALTALWAVIVGFQVRNNDKTLMKTLADIINDEGKLSYPLGDGFSLKNDCGTVPFTMVDHGTTVCKLLKAESAISIVCLGLWAVTLLLSMFLFCIVRRSRNKSALDVKQAHY
ncbi:hypothetical protein H4S08_001873 [Coemansia sp. RSA 1365]|nr:hypothetical protein H4S08_001873 [Coemansia sp. RSA 1365]